MVDPSRRKLVPVRCSCGGEIRVVLDLETKSIIFECVRCGRLYLDDELIELAFRS